MPILVIAILNNRVRLLLRDIDTGGIQWKDAELISWFNEACGEIARVRPEATSKTLEISPLSAGAKQSIPAGDSRLLEVICNSVSGLEGRAVRRVLRSTLDDEDPDWMYQNATDTAFRYAPSLTDPRSFYVYPPSLGGVTSGLSLVASGPATEVVGLTDPMPIPDMYAAAVANYVLFRAFGKLTESTAAQERSVKYINLFNGQMADTTTSMEQNNALIRDPETGAV
jgi:hypothetical protein